MFKTYKSYSDVAFNITIGGKQKRIVFDGQSHGTSIYSTRDTEEQKAIENHYWFNDKFFLTEEVDEKKLAADNKRKSDARAKRKASEKSVHTVSDIQEAKDYLADKFGISRSKMKTTEDILAIAKEHDIVLEGL